MEIKIKGIRLCEIVKYSCIQQFYLAISRFFLHLIYNILQHSSGFPSNSFGEKENERNEERDFFYKKKKKRKKILGKQNKSKQQYDILIKKLFKGEREEMFV